ncbi:MAG TPA: response regulator [candidate division Zixibacteria bacterium]|nr:response regulator [candidate division Zixibacteria bacterium]
MSDLSNSDIRVLVVDDEDIVLSLVRDALEEEEFQVETASNGQTALELAQSFVPDLIITDIRMPKMDGIELVRKAREAQPELVVIFMTGYANLNSAKEAIKQGAFEYIMKPFELMEIRQAVAKAADKIRKLAAEKSPDQQLDRLSNLSQMLYTVADRKSLASLSLKFALMHCDTSYGSVLYWDKERTDFRLISALGEQTEEKNPPAELLSEALSKVDSALLSKPFHYGTIEQHPIYQAQPAPELSEYLIPPAAEFLVQMVTVPIARAQDVNGLIMIGFTDESTVIGDSDLTFLSITASQLALSLENIQLLEESRDAYARLKALQDETIQLEKMATRGEMSAEIGHELNNFLGVVAGNLSLMEFHLKKQNYGELDKYMNGISDNVEKIKRFTSNLMDLTPISGKKEVFRFEKMLTEVVDYLRPQKRYAGVTIGLNAPEEAVPFEADSIHIQQLLYNLFNNAADATVDCATRSINANLAVDSSVGTFAVTIKDTGQGIDPELLKKAFNEKFTTKKNGHGFGLLVCKRIIDSHDGKLSIESAPGQGTSIRVDFPLARAEEVAEPEAIGIPA